MSRASWHRDEGSVVGQLAEWEVWVELVVQSHGRLHVFLPLLDRGIDALIHRLDDVVPRDHLGAALLRGVKPKFKVSPPPRVRGAIARATGFRGEVEVTRRLADVDELTTYRAFPDLETAEIVVLHEESRRVLAVQVKTIGVDRQHRHGTIDVDTSSFRPSATTWVVVAAWDRDARRFRDECLVIPSLEVTQIVAPYRGHIRFPYFPDSPLKWGRLTPYRRPLADLAELFAAKLA